MTAALAVLAVIAAGAAWWAWENAHRTTHPVPHGHRPEIELPYEQEFELYHNALSICSMKARVCMAELRIPYKSHHIDLIETGAYENIRRPFPRRESGRHRSRARPPGASRLRVARPDPLRRAARAAGEPVAGA